MPVVRVNSEGVEIEKLKVMARKRFAKKTSALVVLGMVASAFVYNTVSPEAGIYCGLWPIALSSLLNLHAE